MINQHWLLPSQEQYTCSGRYWRSKMSLISTQEPDVCLGVVPWFIICPFSPRLFSVSYSLSIVRNWSWKCSGYFSIYTNLVKGRGWILTSIFIGTKIKVMVLNESYNHFLQLCHICGRSHLRQLVVSCRLKFISS